MGGSQVNGTGAAVPPTRVNSERQTTPQMPLVTSPGSDEPARGGSGVGHGQLFAMSSEGMWRYDLIPSVPVSLGVRGQARLILARARLAECNEALVRQLGYTRPEEILGRPLTDFMPGTHAEKLGALIQFIRSGYRLGDVEEQRRDCKGRMLWTLTDVVGVVQDGCLAYLWGTQRDITQRKAAEEATVARARQVETVWAVSSEVVRERDLPVLLEHIIRRAAELIRAESGAVYLWDETERILIAGAWVGHGEWFREVRFRLGEGVAGTVAQRREGMIVRDFQSSPFLTPLFASHFRHTDVLAQPLVYRQRLVGAITLGRSSGELPFEARDAEALSGIAAQASIAIVSTRLFQEQERTYAKLRHTQEELVRTERLRTMGEMSAGAVHDLNNMLAAALGQIELLRVRVSNPEVQADLDLLEMTVSDGAGIVRRLQEFSCPRSSTSLTTLDLGEAVREAIAITRPRWRNEGERGGRRIDVRVALPGVLPILGHAPDIREALANLILNAVDAMPEGGTLSFTGAETSEGVALTVADTGVGMPARVIRHIFEPFFTTKGVRGTGLGLSVVYVIMERHGGRIEVTSTPGQGTTFTLHFRAARTDDATPVKPAPPAVPSRHLLLIEDDPIVRQTMADLLRAAGHIVTEAIGGAAGLTALTVHSVDLVLTDLGMPGMSGHDIARAVKAHAPGLPVILVTGWGAEASEESADQGVVDRVLGKPVRLQELLRTVAELTADNGPRHPAI